MAMEQRQELFFSWSTPSIWIGTLFASPRHGPRLQGSRPQLSGAGGGEGGGGKGLAVSDTNQPTSNLEDLVGNQQWCLLKSEHFMFCAIMLV